MQTLARVSGTPSHVPCPQEAHPARLAGPDLLTGSPTAPAFQEVCGVMPSQRLSCTGSKGEAREEAEATGDRGPLLP